MYQFLKMTSFRCQNPFPFLQCTENVDIFSKYSKNKKDPLTKKDLRPTSWGRSALVGGQSETDRLAMEAVEDTLALLLLLLRLTDTLTPLWAQLPIIRMTASCYLLPWQELLPPWIRLHLGLQVNTLLLHLLLPCIISSLHQLWSCNASATCNFWASQGAFIWHSHYWSA